MTKEEIEKEVVNHNHRNFELLDVLKEKGLTESDEVDAEYHFWAFDHEDAISLAKYLYENDFIVLVISPVQDGQEITWNIETRKHGIIADVVSVANTEWLVNLANDHNSIYDGWGART